MANFIGKDSLLNLSKIIEAENVKKALVFRGKKSYDFYKDLIEKELACEIVYYSYFSTNPKEEEIKKSIELIDKDFDIIIAIGGGSVIDFAKGYRYYSKSSKKIIAIPTTFGTGSEATQFAVIYVDGKKHSLDEKSILPEFAIVDSLFAKYNPKYLKACTAMDAYCQAIESYWSVKSNEESRAYAKKAIELCKNNIVEYVNTNSDDVAEKIAEASNLAGMAINISRTTAAHALSYAITTKYGVPHGHAVAYSIAALFDINMKISEKNITDSRGLDFVCARMEELKNIITDDPIVYFAKLFNDIGLEFLQIDAEEVADSVNEQRLANNPRMLTKQDCINVLLNRI